MAKAKTTKKINIEKITLKRILISTFVTVATVEIFTNLMVVALVYWNRIILQNNTEFYSKEIFAISDIMTSNLLGFGNGAIVALSVALGVLALIIDEWFYSHKLNGFYNILILSLTWSLGFFFIDFGLEYFNFFNVQSLYFGPRVILAGIIFILPGSIYLGRLISKKVG